MVAIIVIGLFVCLFLVWSAAEITKESCLTSQSFRLYIKKMGYVLSTVGPCEQCGGRGIDPPAQWKTMYNFTVDLSICGSTSGDSTNLGLYSAVVCLLKKSAYKWTPRFKLVLFKGQMYLTLCAWYALSKRLAQKWSQGIGWLLFSGPVCDSNTSTIVKIQTKNHQGNPEGTRLDCGGSK